jgi:hypothetical protein
MIAASVPGVTDADARQQGTVAAPGLAVYPVRWDAVVTQCPHGRALWADWRGPVNLMITS